MTDDYDWKIKITSKYPYVAELSFGHPLSDSELDQLISAIAHFDRFRRTPHLQVEQK